MPTHFDENILKIPEFRVRKIEKLKLFESYSNLRNWGTEIIGIDAIRMFTTGIDVKIAILDSGCYIHNDLRHCIVDCHFAEGNDNSEDITGHGTHVAGIIAAKSQEYNYLGIAPDAKLYMFKIGDIGAAQEAFVEGVKWAIEKEVDVINISASSISETPILKEVLQEAISKGIVVVASAGNFKEDVDYPGKYHQTISVGSLGKFMGTWGAVGEDLDFVAPGVDIPSTFLDNRYVSLDGASMATPHISGLIALVISLFKVEISENRHEIIKKILIDCCVDIGLPNKDKKYGYGLIDPQRLIVKRLKEFINHIENTEPTIQMWNKLYTYLNIT